MTILFILILSASFFCVDLKEFTVDVIQTYASMTNAGVTGTLTYSFAQKKLSFVYSRLSAGTYTEIFSFNNNYGYGGAYDGQNTYKISPFSACSPCAKYDLRYGFPFLNETNVPNGARINGCQRYDVAAGSFVSYFALNVAGQLCYMADTSGRLWTVTRFISATAATISIPTQCKCLLPIDVAISLDRSGSISVGSTYFYRDFVKELANSFYFNTSDTPNSAQLGISQWSTVLWSKSSVGSLNMTFNPNNVATASNLIGCKTTKPGCGFCSTCSTSSINKNKCDLSPPSDQSESCTGNGGSNTQYTCTGCGLRGVRDLFQDTFYNPRANAKQIMIYITDGRANRLYTPFANNGSTICSGVQCIPDITAQRNSLVAAVPNIETYAIGVSDLVNDETLLAIAGDSSRVFKEASFDSLLANIKKYVDSFCALPDPVTECNNNNVQCCGFCECGQCIAPDTPINTTGQAFCNGTIVVGPNAGGCFTTTQVAPCASLAYQNCNDKVCDPATSTCRNQPRVCASRNCFNYSCFSDSDTCEPTLNFCVTKSPSAAPTNTPTGVPTSAPTTEPTRAPTPPTPAPLIPTASPTEAPTRPPTVAPTHAPTTAPTIPPCYNNGFFCGQFGACCPGNATCCCTNGYSGKVCVIPPNYNECTIDADCFENKCKTPKCVNTSGGVMRCQNTPVDCNDNNACTLDYCDNAVGCVHINTSAQCNDGLTCTVDSCDAQLGCINTPLNITTICSGATNLCNTALCNTRSTSLSPAQLCIQQPIDCPSPTNCSIVYCDINETIPGCQNTTYSCDVAYFGIVAGVAAGIIAGVVIAGALILAGACAGGSAYAVSHTSVTDDASKINVSPLYKPGTKSSVGLSA